jgi:hypothetical protein
MAQQIYQLKMVYHKRNDGTICLLKSQGTAFGFSDESLLASFLILLGEVQGLTPIVKSEEVMVDSRFPIVIDPDKVHITALIAETREMSK